uniref:CD40 ligand n=1 Tax=Semicossyphus pulcher TaxID=241346 RepID=UPI0037E8E8E7
MINTYHTSAAPPPVPPRHDGSHPVLFPAPLPSRGHSKSLIQFLVGVVLLHLFLSIGGFIYLSHIGKMEKLSPPEGKVSSLLSEMQKDLSSEKQRALSSEKSYRALASMVVDQKSRTKTSTAGYLQWDTEHSVLRNISSFYKSWLTIEKSGNYFLYSKVTFSKGDSERPLSSRVMLRKSKTAMEKVAMQAYCSLDSHKGSVSIPRLCTASQGEVVALEEGNQLSVRVQDLSLVDYDEGATAFGMYQL